MTIKLEKLEDSQDLPRETKDTMPYHGNGHTTRVTDTDRGGGFDFPSLPAIIGVVISVFIIGIGLMIINQITTEMVVATSQLNTTWTATTEPTIDYSIVTMLPIAVIGVAIMTIIVGIFTRSRDF